MFKHLFKLIWNKKKQNFLLMSEILVSFLVIFAVFTLVVYYFHNYKKPMGLEYEHVWVINYSNSYQTKNADSLNLFYKTLVKTIKSMPQVKQVSFTSDNIPFAQNMNSGGITVDNKKIDGVNWYTVDDNYNNVLNMELLEGRWFENGDDATKDKPIVINSDLKEKQNEGDRRGTSHKNKRRLCKYRYRPLPTSRYRFIQMARQNAGKSYP